MKPEQAVPLGNTKVREFVATVDAVELNVGEVPLRLKPCPAMSPCAVAFTVAVWPEHVTLDTVVAKPLTLRIRIPRNVFMIVT